eukprot:370996_1
MAETIYILCCVLGIICVADATECEISGQVYSSFSSTCEDSMVDDCMAEETYDATTNECVQTYDWGEVRRTITRNIRYVIYGSDGLIDIAMSSNTSYSAASNDTNCNHGVYYETNNTCNCDDGWRTSPIQDLFEYIWCNESVYDEEYYGSTQLTQNKLIGYQLFIASIIASFACAFMLKAIIKTICCCVEGSKRKKRKRKRKRKKKHGNKYEMVSKKSSKKKKKKHSKKK